MTTAAQAANGPPDDLEQLVARCLNEPISAWTKLAGGLSPRQFFRLRRASGEPAIAMWLPEDAPERVLARQLGRRLPFVEIRELLENARVRVPRLHGAWPELGLLVVEDLGETLAERLSRTPEDRDALYRRATTDLARAQQQLAELPADSIVRTRSFDRALLSLELEHFREWGVEALGEALSSSERAEFDRASRQFVDAIASLEQAFVHRDYQSRNLLALPDGSIGWIDFQDALLGPRAYDLVALLRDSYQSFEEAFVAARLDDFAAAQALTAESRAALGHELDLITVQRKLKDAGRFVFFERTRGDASYLRFYVPTLELVAGALSRLPAQPGFGFLSELVARQIAIGRSRGMLAT